MIHIRLLSKRKGTTQRVANKMSDYRIMMGLVIVVAENLNFSPSRFTSRIFPCRFSSLFQGFSGSSSHRRDNHETILRGIAGMDRAETGTEKDIGVDPLKRTERGC